MSKNQNAARLVQRLVHDAETLRLRVLHDATTGARLIDAGIEAVGGLEAGQRVAEICMAGLGQVRLVPGGPWSGMPAVEVTTDHPVAGCMAAQYAGWQIQREGFFAMGSGPMRALASIEPLFERIGYQESDEAAVGVLETHTMPPAGVLKYVAETCRVAPRNLTLIVAPTASMTGTIQVVARTVETALHKLSELGFPLRRIVSGYGVAPLPPVAADDLTAIGRTNDAVLYGGEVVLWLHGGEVDLETLGPKIPSCASPDFGRPFIEIFKAYDHDFYKIDANLFSPAVVTLVDLDCGKMHRFGRRDDDLLRRSFAT